MRRPPDKVGQPTLSEKDVESSNATLNTLFRGNRQKSWMLGPGAPVRPTPRTYISKAAVPQSTSAHMYAVLCKWEKLPPNHLLTAYLGQYLRFYSLRLRVRNQTLFSVTIHRMLIATSIAKIYQMTRAGASRLRQAQIIRKSNTFQARPKINLHKLQM